MAVLRSVAKSDTLERQRQVINLIGLDLYNTTAGDSDLAAGNIKLGDGTASAPSLSFTGQDSLGLYRPESDLVRWVGSTGDLLDIGEQVKFYKNTFAIQKAVFNGGLSILNAGTDYEEGTYTAVPLLGGTGVEATVDLTVTGIIGSVTTIGSGYDFGTYTNVPMQTDGSGTGALANFNVTGIEGTITDAGSGYTQGYYEDIDLTNISSSGTGAKALISVDETNTVNDVIITDNGSGYAQGDVLSAAAADIGDGSGFEFTISNVPGVVDNFTVIKGGSGYDTGDNLTLGSFIDLEIDLVADTGEYILDDVSFIGDGANVSVVSGSGALPATFVGVNYDTNTILFDFPPTASGLSVVRFDKAQYLRGGNGSGFEFDISNVGEVTGLDVNVGGSSYEIGDQFTVNAVLLTQPIEKVVTLVSEKEITFDPPPSAGSISIGSVLTDPSPAPGTLEVDVTDVETSGGVITRVRGVARDDRGDEIVPGLPLSGNNVDLVIDVDVIHIDGVRHPDLTLYELDTYRFKTTDAPGFYLSQTPDGIHYTIESVSVTSTSGSDTVTVSTGAGPWYKGMDLTGSTAFPSGSKIADVSTSGSTTTLTISSPAITSATEDVTFSGGEYTVGKETEIIGADTYCTITITSDTDSPLYYYNASLPGGGIDLANGPAELTMDPNNPKPLGSGFLLEATDIQQNNLLAINSVSGVVTITDLAGSTGNIGDLTTNNITGGTGALSTSLDVPVITHDTSITVTSPQVKINGDVKFGTDQVTFTTATNVLETTGQIKSTSLIVDNIVNIDNNEVFASGEGNDLELGANGTGRIVRTNGTTAFAVPSGTTGERPPANVAIDGCIRYNTETYQYEGYNSDVSSWTSLGGVRDVDGNTKITAELDVNVNDNILRFYNDGPISAKLSTEYLEFAAVNKIRSVDPTIPAYEEWQPNTFVTDGTYLKYRNNLFLVVGGDGTTDSLSNAPVDTSGTAFSHGNTQLQFIVVAVRDLVFTECLSVQLGPNNDCPLVVSNETKILDNNISSLSKDLYITPAQDKKVVVDSITSFVIPAGASGDRGIPAQGSIRYNTDITQFEGYNGASWSSLGGVRDVDGDTYIAPELTPGGDQDTLYFVNQDKSTLEITTTAFNFGEVDTIQSSVTNELNVTVKKVTFGDAIDTSLDHNDNGLFTDRVYLSTTKANLELGVSAGLTNRPMFRITETGEFQSNAYALLADLPYWATFTDNIGSQLNQRDYGFKSQRIELVRGTNDTFNVVLYDNQLVDSCTLEIQAYGRDGTLLAEKEYIQYVITDNRADILYNEISSLQTGPNLVKDIIFEYESPNLSGDTLGNVRVRGTLDDAIPNGDAVRFVFIIRSINNVALI